MAHYDLRNSGCFGCSCDPKNLPKADLDRFTDKIENVLNDEKGRKLFSKFMSPKNCNMKEGLKVLNFWEKVDKLQHRRRNSDDNTYNNSDIDRLIDAAENIESFDSYIITNLMDAVAENNNEKIKDALNVLKVESAKALTNEYDKFKDRLLKEKKP